MRRVAVVSLLILAITSPTAAGASDGSLQALGEQRVVVRERTTESRGGWSRLSLALGVALIGAGAGLLTVEPVQSTRPALVPPSEVRAAYNRGLRGPASLLPPRFIVD